MIASIASVVGAIATVLALLYAARQLKIAREQAADRGLRVGARRTGRVRIHPGTGERRQQVNIFVESVGSGTWSDLELMVCERDGALVEKLGETHPRFTAVDGRLDVDSTRYFTSDEISMLYAVVLWVEPAGTSLRQKAFRLGLQDGNQIAEQFVWRRFQRYRRWYQRRRRRWLPLSGIPRPLGKWKREEFYDYQLSQIPGIPQAGRTPRIKGLTDDDFR